MIQLKNSGQLATVLLFLIGTTGCVHKQYQFGLGPGFDSIGPSHSNPQPNPLTVGGEHPQLDRAEHVLHWPKRFARKLFHKEEPTLEQVEAERAQSVALAQQYLQANGLEDVYIDVRRYEPGQQWARMQTNDRIAPFWKATGGTLSFLSYSLIPRRALHSDHYDPFANTLSLNSGRATHAIYQAAMAKEYRQQRLLGTYAMLQYAPLVSLVHHAQATSDVLTYAHVTQQDELLRKLYPTTYARLGSVAASEALPWTPLAAAPPFFAEPLIRLSGRAIGAVTGHAVTKLDDQAESAKRLGH